MWNIVISFISFKSSSLGIVISLISLLTSNRGIFITFSSSSLLGLLSDSSSVLTAFAGGSFCVILIQLLLGH